MKKHVILFLLSTITLLSCHNKMYLASNMPEDRIEWGEGGGFAGSFTTYVLLKSGQIFKDESMNPGWKEIMVIDDKEARKLFREFKSEKLDEVKLLENGNMTYFLRLKGKDKSTEITWGTESTPPATVFAFFTKLNCIAVPCVNR